MIGTDAEIQQAVTEELRWDTRVNDAEVRVCVDDRVVTLRGAVDSWAQRVAAQSAAERVRGVLEVTNDICVATTGSNVRTDVEIAHAVRHALVWDVSVPNHRIQSTVFRGWVTLSGDVDLYQERASAERAVLNLVGVMGINNRIHVTPRESLRMDVKRVIQDALSRRLGGELSGLIVDVAEGRVRVKGSVRSALEKDAVADVVKSTRGVRDMLMDIRVEPEHGSSSIKH